MAQLICVYVGKKAITNFNHGIEKGIWGFNNIVGLDLKGKINPKEDLYILFASGGAGHALIDEWNSHVLERIYLEKVSSELIKENKPEWPNEVTAATVLYPWRLRLKDIKVYKNVPPNELGEISEALRLSSTSKTKGQLLSNIDIVDLQNDLSKYSLQNNEKNINDETKESTSKPQVIKKSILSIPKPKDIISHVYKYMESKGFQYQLEDIANFYLALKTKPFVILAGISGTGKTQLPRKFAAAIGMSKEQVIQVPVRPDWADSSDLLGFVGLDRFFKPNVLTDAIIIAHANKQQPYFFILDEMNLARVEHYFSDYLSIIETREIKGEEIFTDPIIREGILHTAEDKEQYKDLSWPENLYLIGTVNMDETTHAFSRKVLDRANSIEMNDVNLEWLGTSVEIINPFSGIYNSFFKTSYLSGNDLNNKQKEDIKNEMALLVQVNKILEIADLHFAYRVRDEVAFYLLLNKEYELLDSNTAMDFQLVQKVLPRIHGSSERVQIVLVKLLNLLEDKTFKEVGFEFEDTVGKIDVNTLKYRRTSKKILFMLKRFDDDRFTSFWL